MNNQEFLEALRKRHACWPGFKWVGLRSLEEAVRECPKPNWVMWLMQWPEFRSAVYQELLDACAEAEPWCALIYAAQFLTAERLDKCSKENPLATLECAARYLTPELLDKCAEENPWYALEYAARYLTPERKKWCEEKMAKS